MLKINLLNIKYLRPVKFPQAILYAMSSYIRIPNDQISPLVLTLSSTRYSKAEFLSLNPP